MEWPWRRARARQDRVRATIDTDTVIVIAYAAMEDEEARTFEPQVVFVDRQNRIVEIGHDVGDVPDGFGLRTSAVTHRAHD